MNTDMKHFTGYWLPVILYAALIFTISSFPRLVPRIEIPYMDKFAHLVEYGILGFLFYRALKSSKLVRQAFTLTIVFSILYALSDEFHQSFVVGRDCDLWDLLADSLGVVLVALYLRHKHGLARNSTCS